MPEIIESLPPVEAPSPTVKDLMRDLKVGQAIKTELTGGSARVYCSELNNQMKREGWDNTYRRRTIDGVVYIERVT